MAVGFPQPAFHDGETWGADILPDWVGMAADLTLLLDKGGIIRSLACQKTSLLRELEGAAKWRDRPWASTATPQTRSAVEALLRDAPLDPALRRRHVDQLTSGGGSIPLLYSAARVGTHIVAFGRDLRSLDLTSIVLDHEVSIARAYARAIRLSGMGLETLWLDILAPAARRLGDLWLEDACGFDDVTAGVGCLQDVLYDSARLPETAVRHIVQSKRILLAASPGEQHTFGLAMVTALFRQAGWYVRHEDAPSETDLAQAVERNWFAVVGISQSDESRLGALTACIRNLRRVSRNNAVRIMVGGSLFTAQPELAVQVEADATAFDGRQAVRQAQRLLDGRHKTEPL